MSNHKSDCGADNDTPCPVCGSVPDKVGYTNEPGGVDPQWYKVECWCGYQNRLEAHNALAGVIDVARDVANGDDCLWSLVKATEALDKFKETDA